MSFYSITTIDDIHFSLKDDEDKVLLKNIDEKQVETLERIIKLAEDLAPQVKDYPRVDRKPKQIQSCIDKAIALAESTYANKEAIEALKAVMLEELPNYENLIKQYIDTYETMLLCAFSSKQAKIIGRLLSRIIKH